MLPSLSGLSLSGIGGKLSPGQKLLNDVKKAKEERARAEDERNKKERQKLIDRKRNEDAEKEQRRASQAQQTFEQVVAGLLQPIGIDQVLQLLMQQFKIADVEVASRKDLDPGDGVTVETALTTLYNEITQIGLVTSRDTASFTTIVQNELARIREESAAYKQAAKNPPPGFVKLSADDKKEIQDRFNRLYSLATPTVPHYTGTLPALDPSLSLAVWLVRGDVHVYSPVGNTLGVHDQALRSWFSSVLDGRYRRTVYDVQQRKINGTTVTGPWVVVGRDRYASMRTLKFYRKFLALAIATKRTSEMLSRRRIVSNDPSFPIAVVGGVSLVGWHIPLPLSDAPRGFADFVRFIRTTPVVRDGLNALCDAILGGMPTRQLGAVVLDTSNAADAQTVADEEGELVNVENEGVGEDEGVVPVAETTAVVPNLCVEFGEGGLTCDEQDRLHDPLQYFKLTSVTNFLNFPFHTRNISLGRGEEGDSWELLHDFRNENDVSVVVSWGDHARVLFKTGDGGVAIVDPHLPAQRVRIPAVVRKVFDVPNVQWVARASEQCQEESCGYVALARALVIAMAAASKQSTMQAAQSDIRTGYGPFAIAMVKLLVYTSEPERLL